MTPMDKIETTDEVIREVRTIKETLAQSLNYDVHRILKDARERQQSSDKKIIGTPDRRPACSDILGKHFSTREVSSWKLPYPHDA
uniref:Uncharacterized protein n=1 Tax=Candidatus Kentrum sp. MB TaxID=2138164 RepID=A0A450XVG9_9GAMM|nr:MAG: hypothetical protein BECKMB1821I_GA0114274_10432 [Candidatus Kentron sp. MB]VFK76074.1 MAG: hypothetical protein BECKMB1821H_GA0114242_10412 [Candidatus Kentron sp. MB]